MSTTTPAVIVVAGVSGSGKSTVAAQLAAETGGVFIDADDLHPVENVERMRRGVPLEDEHRWPWLAALAEAANRELVAGRTVVLACSALRRSYREVLRAKLTSEPTFVLLTGDRETLASRLSEREHHFMPAVLLDSQLRTLEPLDPDERGCVLDVAAPLSELVADAVRHVHGAG